MFGDPYSLIAAALVLLGIICIVLGYQIWKLAEAERKIERLKGDVRAMQRREYAAVWSDILSEASERSGTDAMEEMARLGDRELRYGGFHD